MCISLLFLPIQLKYLESIEENGIVEFEREKYNLQYKLQRSFPHTR